MGEMIREKKNKFFFKVNTIKNKNSSLPGRLRIVVSIISEDPEFNAPWVYS